jgi:MYXO-CTERM domain-containing protein
VFVPVSTAALVTTLALLGNDPPEPPVAFDDVVPGPRHPDAVERPRPPQARKLGTATTIFVNFDGVEISYCDPPNSHANCSWLEHGKRFEPFSGGLAQRVAILDAMRSVVAEFGVRVTGQRPPDDEPYLMLVYAGDSIEEEALGRAPGGDCWDDFPNDIAHVYLDGERRTWINGGASTALHEAAHTWGFDHIGLPGSLMAPAGDNSKVRYFDGCAPIVEDVELTPSSAPSCPQINLELCGLSGFQYDVALLRLLFGEAYVDDRAPQLRLVRPFDGIYYQAPASFAVELEVVDDLHPQIYELEIAVPGLVDAPGFRPVLDPTGFDVEDLPVGEWTFALRLRDAAGNESALAFTVFVGDEAPVLDDGCACRSSPETRPIPPIYPAIWALTALALGLGLRPRRP